MSVARTARRRRKQAAQGFKHLAHIGRPVYPSKRSAEKSQRLLAAAILRENLIKSKARKKA